MTKREISKINREIVNITKDKDTIGLYFDDYYVFKFDINRINFKYDYYLKYGDRNFYINFADSIVLLDNTRSSFNSKVSEILILKYSILKHNNHNIIMVCYGDGFYPLFSRWNSDNDIKVKNAYDDWKINNAINKVLT